MRTIKFRGIDDKGVWRYGYYWRDNTNGKHKITSDLSDDNFRCYEVIPETVGQYVGKIGANSCEVWEGDSVIARLNHHGKPTELKISAFISYNEHVGTWQIKYENHAGQIVSDDIGFRYFLEVIGHIHEQ